ncbi:MAG: leucine dehydrogenase [Lachnospiraceae bacterium]|jgi:leucine dehydrogenase|nr:leucine dehydrogenase [Lachnospiraceae bacterium]
MNTLEQMKAYGHEQIVFVRDEAVGLQAIIAIHDTTLGPALGGTRFWNYGNEEEALFDVLRLSQGMTMKNAAAGLGLGGGKAVIIGDPAKLKSREFFHSYAHFINSLGGKYYTAEDVNISETDVAMINEVSEYVVGTPAISGNPAPFTARGVYMGMKAGASKCFASDSLEGKTVVVQGIGSVGRKLCNYLANEGAIIKVYDIDRAKVDEVVDTLGAIAISGDELLTTECDIFAPCALGAVISSTNAVSLKCRLVAGAANNVLVDAAAGKALAQMGILYLPDYIINAGGVINCGMEITGSYDVGRVNEQVDKIYDTTLRILALAEEKGISTYQAAEEYAWGVVMAG